MVRIYLLVVLLVSATCAEYCSRPNLDCHSNDIRHIKGKDEAACKAACDAEPTCKSCMIYNETCMLKSKACTNEELRVLIGAKHYVKYEGLCKKSVFARKNHKYCRRADTDCYGNDMTNVGKTENVHVCQDLCDFLPACKSIQITAEGNCWLKNKVCANTELRPFNGGNDYVKALDGKCAAFKNPKQKYCKREDMECVGGDIHMLDWVKTQKQCTELCDWFPACKSIHYKASNCVLKNKACTNDQLTPSPGASDYMKIAKDGSCKAYKVRGIHRFCKRPNKDCQGYNILTVKTTDVKKCQSFCSYNAECKSVVFHDGKCSLKKDVCLDTQLSEKFGYTEYVKIDRKDKCKPKLAELADCKQ